MNSPTNRTGGYIALCITSIVWGTTWVTSKIGVSEMPPFQMAAIRQFLGGISFVLFFLLFRKTPLPSARQFGLLVVMSLLMFVGANGLSTWSLQFIPTGLSSLIGALYPLSVVLIEMIFFRNKDVSALTFAGLLLGIFGIGIVFYESAFHSRPPGFFFGVFLSVSAMLCWAVGTIIISRNKIKVNPYFATGWQMLISSGILVGIALLSKQTIPVAAISTRAWLAIGYLVVAGSLISFIAFIYSMKQLPASLFSLYAYFNPLVAIVVAGLLIKHETPSIYVIVGAIVTLFGVFLVNYSMIKARKRQIIEDELLS